MVIKINSKPILVTDEPEKQRINWVSIGLKGTGCLLGLTMLDLVSWLFIGSHPFSFMKFMEVVWGWFL